MIVEILWRNKKKINWNWLLYTERWCTKKCEKSNKCENMIAGDHESIIVIEHNYKRTR